MDIHESENALEVTAELPGVSQNDVDLLIEGDVLTIRGEKRNERRDKRAHVVERAYGGFQQEKAHKIQVGRSKTGQKNIEGTATENPQKGTEAKATAKK